MCKFEKYCRIKWCGDKISDVRIGLSRAARLLGHIQYFKHYRNLQPLYRDGPNPGKKKIDNNNGTRISKKNNVKILPIFLVLVPLLTFK